MIRIPQRPSKPRRQGRSQILDRGMDLQAFSAMLADHHPYIDLIKFGWGTALITPQIRGKLAHCRARSIEPILGGTLFEYCILTDQYAEFLGFLDALELQSVEVSNGSERLEQSLIHTYIKDLARHRHVYLEIGSKDAEAADSMGLQTWIEQIEAGLQAGAKTIILESRESGQSGYCNHQGLPRPGFCEALLQRFSLDQLLFEAPTRNLQATLIRQFGPEVNLANIAPADVIGLETLRLGLRFDTLAQVPLPPAAPVDQPILLQP